MQLFKIQVKIHGIFHYWKNLPINYHDYWSRGPTIVWWEMPISLMENNPILDDLPIKTGDVPVHKLAKNQTSKIKILVHDYDISFFLEFPLQFNR